MDPVTITATCLQVAGQVLKASSAVAIFVNSAISVDIDLKDLSSELQSLHSQIIEIRSVFQAESFITAMRICRNEDEINACDLLHNHLKDCASSTERLHRVLRDITPLGNDSGFFRKGVVHIQLEIKAEEIAKLRAQIQSQKTSLLVSLQVMQTRMLAQSKDNGPIQTEILSAKIEMMEKSIQELSAQIRASKKWADPDDDKDATQMLDDMEATCLVATRVKEYAASEVARRSFILSSDSNNPVEVLDPSILLMNEIGEIEDHTEMSSSPNPPNSPISSAKEPIALPWYPSVLTKTTPTSIRATRSPPAISMQPISETEEFNDQTQEPQALYLSDPSDSSAKNPSVRSSDHLIPLSQKPDADTQNEVLSIQQRSFLLRKRESETMIASPPLHVADMISNEEFEESVATIISEAEARLTIPGKPYSEEVFTEISHLLNLVGKPQWSERPRTYLVLRSIGEVQAIGSFIFEQLNDVQFPYTEASLPHGLLSSAGARHSFLQKQSIVVSDRPADLIKGGRHRNLAKSADQYFDVLRVLGTGGQGGVVDEVKSKLSFKHYARKRIQRSTSIARKKDVVKKFENEIKIIKELSKSDYHPHLVKFVGSYTDPKYIGFIVEPVAETDLSRYLKHDSFSDEDLSMLRGFLGCLATAVAFLHSKNIRHKDLKPGNILIDKGKVLITDFGIALDWTDLGHDTTQGSPEAYTNSYVAPEVVAAKPRNVASDIWSLGCVFVDITTVLKGESLAEKKLHFKKTGSESLCAHNNREALQEWLSHLEGKSEVDLEPLVWIRKMTSLEPRHRPTAGDLFQDILHAKGDHRYCGFCCDDASTDSWAASDSDEEQISITRNTTTSNASAMKTSLGSPLLSESSAAKGKSPMSEASFKGKPKLPRFPWQDTTVTSPSTAYEPLNNKRTRHSGAWRDHGISESQSPDSGHIDTMSEASADINRGIGQNGYRNHSEADSSEQFVFHTYRTGHDNSTQAVPVSLDTQYQSQNIPALLLENENDHMKRNQEIANNHFKESPYELEQFLISLRSKGDGIWKEVLKGIDIAETDKRGYEIFHLVAHFDSDSLSRDAVEAILQPTIIMTCPATQDPSSADIPLSELVNRTNIYGNSPLHYAAHKNRGALVKYLLKFGAKIDQTNIRKQTPLHVASQTGSAVAVRVLAINGTHDLINMKDDYGRTALHWACQISHIGIVRILLDSGASLDEKDENDLTPRELAWSGYDEDFPQDVENLLSERGNAIARSPSVIGSPTKLEPPQLLTRHKRSLRSVSSRLDFLKPCICEVCKLTAAVESIPHAAELELLKCSCQEHLKVLSVRALSGFNLLKKALKDCRCPKCILSRKATDKENRTAKLNDSQSSINSNRLSLPAIKVDREFPLYCGNDLLDNMIENEIAESGHNASHTDDDQSRNAIETLSEAGFKGKNSYRTNPAKAMVWAMNDIDTIEHLEAVIQLLLECGAPVDTVNKDNCTFLHLAACHGKLRAAHILIQKGANVNAVQDSFRSTTKWTPLKYAVWMNQRLMMRLLLRNGGDINHQSDSDNRRTLLHTAVINFTSSGSHIPIFLAHNASLHTRDSFNQTPFHLAIKSGNLPVSLALFDAGADIDAEVNPGQKALSFAIESANPEMVAFLVQRGADVHSPCGEHVCALMHTVKGGNPDVLQALLNNSPAGTDINRKNASGYTVLHVVANTVSNTKKLLNILGGLDADIAVEDNMGSTPLHEAAKAGNGVMVHFLLYKGAIQHRKNHSGKTPLDLAQANKHKEVVGMLGGKMKRRLFRRS